MRTPSQYYEEVVLKDPAHMAFMETYIAHRLGLTRRSGESSESSAPPHSMGLDVLIARMEDCRTEYCTLRQRADGLTDIPGSQFSRLIGFLHHASSRDDSKAIKDEFRTIFIFGLMKSYDVARYAALRDSAPPEVESMLAELMDDDSLSEDHIEGLIVQLALFENTLIDNIRVLPEANKAYDIMKSRYQASPE